MPASEIQIESAQTVLAGCLKRILGLIHLVGIGFEHHAQGCSNSLFIVHQENALPPDRCFSHAPGSIGRASEAAPSFSLGLGPSRLGYRGEPGPGRWAEVALWSRGWFRRCSCPEFRPTCFGRGSNSCATGRTDLALTGSSSGGLLPSLAPEYFIEFRLKRFNSLLKGGGFA